MSLKKSLSGIMLASALALPVFAVGETVSPAKSYASSNDIVNMSTDVYASDAQRLLDKINSYRKSKGLQPVKYSVQLSKVVQWESDKQVTQEWFGHSDSFLTKVRGYSSANEIIALSSKYRDVDTLFNFWVNSPSHNKALLGANHNVIGIGITYADGSLEKTGKPWRILSTINLYGMKNQPHDSSSTVRESINKNWKEDNRFYLQNGFRSLYYSSGGLHGYGEPNTNERATNGGAYQFYDKHTFFWSNSTQNSYPVYERGAIGSYWRSVGAEHNLGMPDSFETGHNENYYQIFRKNNGQRTLISWTPSSGINLINGNGGLFWSWQNNGGVQKFGVPVTGEYGVGNGGYQMKTSYGYTFTWYPHSGTSITR